jgi:CheY-like chemotaxis protein
MTVSDEPSRPRVLCVDDNTDTCELVQAALKEWNVSLEYTQQEGLQSAASLSFDLILVDYRLPDGNGLDLCRRIRTFDVTTPILLITADPALSHEDVIAAGGQGLLRKDHFGLMLPAAVAQMLDLKLHGDM